MMWMGLISTVPPRFSYITWEGFNGSVRNTSVQTLRGNFSGGWTIRWRTPFTTSGSYENYAQFVIADVDDDGDNEVLARYSSVAILFDGSSGTTEWTFSGYRTGWMPAPAVGDINGDGLNEVVTDESPDRIVALAGGDGTVLWRRSVGGTVYSSPKIWDINGDGTAEVVVGSDDRNVYVLRGTDGSVLCRYTTGGEVRSTPALSENAVVVGSFDNRVYYLDSTCSLVWSYTTGGRVWSSPILIDINRDSLLDVIVGSSDGFVYALDGATGSVIWRYNTGCEVRSAPASADVDWDSDVEVIVGNTCGRVLSLTAASGAVEWSRTLSNGVWPYGAIGLADLLPSYSGMEILVLTENGGPWSSNHSYLLSSSGTLIRDFPGYGDGFAIGDADGDGCVEVMLECDGCGSGKDALYDSPTNDTYCGPVGEDGELGTEENGNGPTYVPPEIYTIDGRKVQRPGKGIFFVRDRNGWRKVIRR